MLKNKKLTEEEIKDKKQLAKDYSAMVESKLRKAENHTWLIKDLDYLEQ